MFSIRGIRVNSQICNMSFEFRSLEIICNLVLGIFHLDDLPVFQPDNAIGSRRQFFIMRHQKQRGPLTI